MKRLFKKEISLALCFVIVLSLFSVLGFTDIELPDISNLFAFKVKAATSDIFTYEIYDDEVSITDCDENASGAIVIPSMIEGYPVTSIASSLFMDNTAITSVTVPEGVTSINSFTFSGCRSLSNVYLSEGLKYIEYSAFYGCENLSSIDIPESVVGISDYAFYGCKNLTNVSLPTNIEYVYNGAFAGCTNLSDISISDSVTGTIYSDVFNDTAYYNNASNWENSVLYIGKHLIDVKEDISGSYSIKNGTKTIARGAFENCKNLTGISFPESLKNISTSFDDCENLTDISIPDTVEFIVSGCFVNTAYYKDNSNWENGVLYICNHLIKANNEVSGLYTAKNGTLTVASYAFNGCENITKIVLPDGLKYISTGAFSSCTNLTLITLPDTITEIGNRAFDYCPKLATVELPNGITAVSQALFSSCSGLKSVIVPESVTEIGNSAFSYCSSLTDIVIPDNVTSIGYSAFYGCTALKNVYISCGVKEILDCAFYNCDAITGISIPDGVEKIGEFAFGYCDLLESVTIPSSVKEIGHGAFLGCESLTSINVDTANENYSSDSNGYLYNKDKTELIQYLRGKNETSFSIPDGVKNIGSNAFSGCVALETVVIPESVTEIGSSAFSGCESLKNVNIPESVTEINDYIFRGCKALADIDIPANAEKIGYAAFSGCIALESVDIPESVAEIGRYAFSECEKITEITLPSKVTKISDDLFNGCSGLKKVVLPEDITTIGYSAFSGCESLENITIPAGVTEIEAYAFEDCKSLSEINIPAEVSQIGGGSFRNCTRLETVTFEEGSKLTRIEWNTFYMCTSLNAIDVPENVTDIRSNAFYGCINLKTISLPDNLIYVDSSAFEECGYVINEENWENGVLYIDNVLYAVDNDVVAGDYAIKDTTTYIVERAFKDCDNLTSITIPAGVKAIGYSTFYDCDSLTSVTFADNSKLETIGSDAFEGCWKLATVNIPASVKEIGSWAFYNTALSGEVLPADSKLETIGNSAFYSCDFTEINIPSTVKSIGGDAFNSCSNLEKINVDAANEFYSSDSNGVLYNKDKTVLVCYPYGLKAESYTIPAGIKEIGYRAFCDVYNTSNIRFAENSSLEAIGEGAFYSCSGIATDIVIPNGVKKIGSKAFYQSSVVNVTIPESVTEIGYLAFAQCYNLHGITVDPDNTAYCSDADGVLFNKAKTELIQYPRMNADTSYSVPDSVTKISDYAFYFSNLESVNFSANSKLVTIGQNAFQDCNKITVFDMPDTVTSIGHGAFIWCDKLSNVTLSDGLITIGSQAFESAKLTSIIIPSSVVQISSSAFRYCSELATVTISDDSNLEEIGGEAFYGCNKLEEIFIPSKVRYISFGYSGSFDNCNSLKKITVDENNEAYSSENGVVYNKDKTIIYLYPAAKTETAFDIPYGVKTITERAFCGASALTDITIPETVTSIGQDAFYGTGYYNNEENWENGVLYIGNFLIEANNSVPAECVIKEGTYLISNYAFDCREITSVTIPDSVYYIGNYAFDDCDLLTDVYYGGSPSEWEETVYKRYSSGLNNKTMHYGRSDEKATVSDENTDISLEYYSDIYDGSVVDITVTESTDETAFDIISTEVEVSQNLVYDIKMTVDGVETQPKGKITVRIPLPEGYRAARTFVYHVDTENGRVEKMDAKVENINGKDYLVFDTTHFSYYAVVEEKAFTVTWIVDGEKTEVDYKAGDLIEKPANPVKEGYVFLGWGAEIPETMPENDLTFTAQFEKIVIEIPTTKPVETTTKPAETTTKPAETTTKPVVTTTEPTTAPITKPTTKPTEPTTQPTTKPVVTVPVPSVEIRTPSQTEISYGDSIILHADTKNLPEGAYIEWSVSSGNFKIVSHSVDRENCTVTPEVNGADVITATVYDAEGNEICSDSQTMTAKAGFFQKIIAFFKKLFGLTKIIPAIFKNIF